MGTLSRLLLALVGLMLLAAPISATVHNIQVGNFFFTPTKTVVSPGDTVRWTLVSGLHSTTSTPASAKIWDSGIMTTVGTQFQVVFSAGDGPGPFPYECSVHPLTMKDTIFMAPAAEPTRFAFLLDASQAAACAGTGSSARGYGLAVLSPDSTELSLFIVHDVVGAIDAHVHLGAPCVSGGIAFGFASPASPIQEAWSLSPADVADLFNGDLYVNIHSGAFPAGEIRGQIVQTPIRMLFNLDEAQAAGGAGTGSFASGFGRLDLNAAATELAIQIRHDVAAPIDAHVHLGAPGVSGGVVFPFPSATSPITASWAVDTTDLQNLFLGDLYANIHSTPFPAGEIRGQLVRESARFAFPLTEAEAAGGAGTGSSATGFAVCELNADQTALSVYVEHTVSSPIDGHVHLGAPGVSGPVQFGFSSSVSPISETWALGDADIENLLAGNLYINIHSTPFPAGEIRGQLDREPTSVSFALDEAQAAACAGTGSSAVGAATAVLKGEAQSMTIALTHDVASPIDAHVHIGAPCVSGPVLFGTGFNSPVASVGYLATSDVIEFLRGNLYLNVHSTPFPAGEIRGQLAEAAAVGCCTGSTGNVNADAGNVVNLSDLTVLINNLFVTFDPLPCVAEANVNGDAGCSINLSDVTKLVNHLFVTFEAIASCSDFSESACN